MRKIGFNGNEKGIIAYSAVQVLGSCVLEDTTIPLFKPGNQVHLSVMEEDTGNPWLRINRSPDHFAITQRTEDTSRLQYDWIWIDVANKELELLFGKAEAAQPNSTAHLN